MNTTIVMLLFLAGAVVHEAIGAETELEILQSNLTEQAALIQALQGNLTEQAALIQALQNKIQKSMVCAVRSQWAHNNQTIDSYVLTTHYGTSKVSQMNDGIFTVETEGVYKIRVSGNAAVDAKNTIRVYTIYRGTVNYNDRIIYTYSQSSRIHDTLSGTRVKKMYEGDTFGLFYEEEGPNEGVGNNAFNNIEFCVELIPAL